MTNCPNCGRKVKKRVESRNDMLYKIHHCTACGYEKECVADRHDIMMWSILV